MTCNMHWPEIQSMLRPGQDYTDILMVIIHIFKTKLHLFQATLKKMFINAGWCVYLILSIEFQKHSLLHVHMLFKMKCDCVKPSDIDAVISAEMPEHMDDTTLVNQYMVHRHPSPQSPPSKSMGLANVVSTILTHCHQEQQLIARVMFTTVGDMQVVRTSWPIVYLCYESSNATSIWRLQTLCTSFSIWSSTLIKVTDLLPPTNIFSSICKGPHCV